MRGTFILPLSFEAEAGFLQPREEQGAQNEDGQKAVEQRASLRHQCAARHKDGVWRNSVCRSGFA